MRNKGLHAAYKHGYLFVVIQTFACKHVTHR